MTSFLLCAFRQKLLQLLAVLLVPVAAAAAEDLAPDPVQRACNWLIEQQAENGLWSPDSNRTVFDSFKTVSALAAVNSDDTRLASLLGQGALLLQLPNLPDTTIKAAVEVHLLKTPPLADALFSCRNPDGGWGPADGFASSLVSTCDAIAALCAVDLNNGYDWVPTVDFLVDRQQPDGLWLLADEKAPGVLELSANILERLLGLSPCCSERGAEIYNACKSAESALLLTQQLDGGFGFGSNSSITASAAIYCALVRTSQPGLYLDTLRFLLEHQAANGSWQDTTDPAGAVYQTATVLEALTAVQLAASEPAADLVIRPVGITLQNPEESVEDLLRVEAIVFNEGEVDTEQFQVNFYLGNPHSGGMQIGNPVSIDRLGAGRSKKVTAMLDCRSLTHDPVIWVHADPDHMITDSDRSNNLACREFDLAEFAPVQGADKSDLFVDAVDFTFNGSNKNEIFLSSSPAVEVGLVVSNLTSMPAAGFLLEVEADEKLIARQHVNDLQAYDQRLLSIPWLPTPGQYQLKVTLDPDNQIDEANEKNNSAECTVTIIGSNNEVHVRTTEGAPPPFAAFTACEFIVTSEYSNPELSLTLFDPDGTPVSVAPLSLPQPGRYHWNTANSVPGLYTAEVIFRDSVTGAVLDEKEKSFTIASTVGLRNFQCRLDRQQILSETTAEIAVSVTLQNGSNLDSTWALGWELLDPDGAIFMRSTSDQALSLNRTQLVRSIDLQETAAGTFDRPGQYRFCVTAAAPDVAPVTGEAVLNVLPVLHLQITNAVIPDKIAPVASAKVRTLLQLTAVSNATANSGIPVAIGAIEVDPATAIPDTVDAEATIRLERITDAFGRIVPDGTVLCIQCPYGTIAGQAENVPEALDNSSLFRITVKDGAATLLYQPAGTALDTEEYSLTVMRFHQYFPGETEWFGNKIGSAQVFLKGL